MGLRHPLQLAMADAKDYFLAYVNSILLIVTVRGSFRLLLAIATEEASKVTESAEWPWQPGTDADFPSTCLFVCFNCYPGLNILKNRVEQTGAAAGPHTIAAPLPACYGETVFVNKQNE